MPEKNYMGIDELCAYLNIGRTTAYRLIREKKIPAKKIASKWRVRKSDVDAYINA